ncbi:MAG TPA: hypothetical protein VFP54_11630 [Acidimicrobiales bacterium]|nr:hypothetical protein [Acidimicrobiales bacterium]
MADRRGAVAAVDLGTHSTRLLVVDAEGATVERLMTITRMGEGVDASGRLSGAAIGRTVECLRRYRAVMDACGVVAARAAATSAARDAANGDELLDAAEAILGVRPQVLGGVEEGRLAFAGATSGRPDSDGPFVVVDIGGGSTELSVGRRGREPAVVSVDLGCVRITERHLGDDPPTAEQLHRAADAAREVLGAAAEATGAASARTMIGLAGTVSAAAMLDLGTRVYDRSLVHGHRLGRASVERHLAALAAVAAADRVAMGVESERRDVIVGGMILLVAALDVTGRPECVVSEADILDGLAATVRGGAGLSP